MILELSHLMRYVLYESDNEMTTLSSESRFITSYVSLMKKYGMSNKRLYEWLLNHPKLGTYISNFMVHKAIPMRVKVVSITALWLTLSYCAVFATNHWILRIAFVTIAIAVTVHILSYKTLK